MIWGGMGWQRRLGTEEKMGRKLRTKQTNKPTDSPKNNLPAAVHYHKDVFCLFV